MLSYADVMHVVLLLKLHIKVLTLSLTQLKNKSMCVECVANSGCCSGLESALARLRELEREQQQLEVRVNDLQEENLELSTEVRRPLAPGGLCCLAHSVCVCVLLCALLLLCVVCALSAQWFWCPDACVRRV